MKTAIDSNILFDLLTNDPRFAASSRRALTAAAGAGSLVICPIVYAELATRFTATPSDLDLFLGQLGIVHDPFESGSLKRGAEAWQAYLRARGQDAQCPHCGHTFTITCPHCQATLRWRQHILPDFLVGGHAQVQADTLLTRDQCIYRTYFPQLSLTIPTP